MQEPKISVLMSCYNAERWLSKAIESVLCQSLGDFEFIIVNDGSTDRTKEILELYARKDSRVCVLDKQNTGLADSLNCGIRVAQGEWIARLDADDVCDPRRLERQLDHVLRNPETVLLGSGFVEIDEVGREIKTHLYPTQHRQLLRRLERVGAFFPHSSAFFRRSMVIGAGGYRPRIRRAQDHDLWLRLSSKGTIACLALPLVLIRKHGYQISHEDGGRRQIVDGYVGRISYFINRFGGNDPLEGANDEDVSMFFRWVEKELENAQVFQHRRVWSDARAAYFESPKRLTGFVRFGQRLIQSGYMVPLLKQKFIGSRLAEQIARDWIKTVN